MSRLGYPTVTTEDDVGLGAAIVQRPAGQMPLQRLLFVVLLNTPSLSPLSFAHHDQSPVDLPCQTSGKHPLPVPQGNHKAHLTQRASFFGRQGWRQPVTARLLGSVPVKDDTQAI